MSVTARPTIRTAGSRTIPEHSTVAEGGRSPRRAATKRVRPEHAIEREARIDRENANARLERRMVATLFYAEVLARLTVTLGCIYISFIKPSASTEERQWSTAVLAVAFGRFIYCRQIQQPRDEIHY